MRAARDDRLAYTLALHPGTLLAGRYHLLRVLGGSSPVAVTYLADDQTAQEQVVVKEFLPRTFAGRAADGLTIRPHSGDDAPAFTRALRRFTREADLLADIVHPNIPRVRSHFAANGTAYLVVDYYDGVTAAEHVAASGGRVPVERAVALVMGALGGLQVLHTDGVIHGYVTPQNILVTAESRPLVLALGTTRQVVGQAKEPVPGFAPIEEYASQELGPWTDVYACGAVLYQLLTGTTPSSAIERAAGHMVTLPWPAAADVPSSVARVITSALALLPAGRPHSAEEFRRRLETALGSEPRDSRPRLEERADNLWRRSLPDVLLPTGRSSNDAPVLLAEPELLDEDADLPIGNGRDDRVRRLLRP
ncbi:MAG: serine/threonine protein kinase, partial [Gemmatimonadota bacterium]|nr:serine/threonine protein kinase [Gemmatimonadota bacterium]